MRTYLRPLVPALAAFGLACCFSISGCAENNEKGITAGPKGIVDPNQPKSMEDLRAKQDASAVYKKGSGGSAYGKGYPSGGGYGK